MYEVDKIEYYLKYYYDYQIRQDDFDRELEAYKQGVIHGFYRVYKDNLQIVDAHRTYW